MTTVIQLIGVIALTMSLVGCSVGRDFIRPELGSLSLGKTTYHEILQRFGSPREEGSVTKNDKLMKTATYVYSSAAAKPFADGVTPARGLSFHFLDNDLVGYNFNSSFADDHTNFDESNVNRIKKGETTRQDLVKLFGQPGGVQRFPLVKSKEDEALVWQYLQVKRSGLTFKAYIKNLEVTVGADNIVKDVEYSASGER